MVSLENPFTLHPDDVIESEALSSTTRYGPRYRVIILDVVSFDWGITVFTIESVGYARNEQARRVLRACIQIVDDDVTEGGRWETEYPG